MDKYDLAQQLHETKSARAMGALLEQWTGTVKALKALMRDVRLLACVHRDGPRAIKTQRARRKRRAK